MRKEQEKAIVRHVQNLGRVFIKVAESDALELYAELRQLEEEAHTLAERQCNEDLGEVYIERRERSILRRLDDLIGFEEARVPVFCNGDPRGYGLKIQPANIDAADPQRALARDWGGYGLIAPELP